MTNQSTLAIWPTTVSTVDWPWTNFSTRLPQLLALQRIVFGPQACKTIACKPYENPNLTFQNRVVKLCLTRSQMTSYTSMENMRS